jgi:RNA polymerase sigma factor (sigma-70 family)
MELLRVLRDGRWRGEARLKTYVWRVAAHTCIDLLRRQRRRPALEPVEAGLELPAGGPSALDELVAQGRHRALLDALELVPAECRELWRRILRGESYREISLQSGVAEGALRVRAHRCRKKAIGALGGGGDGMPAGRAGGNGTEAADANG